MYITLTIQSLPVINEPLLIDIYEPTTVHFIKVTPINTPMLRVRNNRTEGPYVFNPINYPFTNSEDGFELYLKPHHTIDITNTAFEKFLITISPTPLQLTDSSQVTFVNSVFHNYEHLSTFTLHANGQSWIGHITFDSIHKLNNLNHHKSLSEILNGNTNEHLHIIAFDNTLIKNSSNTFSNIENKELNNSTIEEEYENVNLFQLYNITAVTYFININDRIFNIRFTTKTWQQALVHGKNNKNN